MNDKETKRETAEAVRVAPPVASASVEKRAPEAWAGECGQRRKKSFEQTVTTVNGQPFDFVGDFLWEHEAAAVLHGWTKHAHHAGEPMQLSRQDYESALKAAGVTNAKGEYMPHPAALSPHKGA